MVYSIIFSPEQGKGRCGPDCGVVVYHQTFYARVRLLNQSSLGARVIKTHSSHLRRHTGCRRLREAEGTGFVLKEVTRQWRERARVRRLQSRRPIQSLVSERRRVFVQS